MTYQPPVERERFLIAPISGTLVIVPAREAARLARLSAALKEAKTWGAFISALKHDPLTTWELERKFDGDLPAADAPFDPNEIPGRRTGDWPPWPPAHMGQWCPDSVLALGKSHATFRGAPIFRISPTLLDEVIEALAEKGIEGIEDLGTTVRDACLARKAVKPEVQSDCESACPFCGAVPDYEEGGDYSMFPECEHYVGRYDPDGQPGSEEWPQFDGGFRFLETTEFPPYQGQGEPAQEAAREAFGECLEVAIGTYSDGFHQPGNARDFLYMMAHRLRLVECTITGNMVWSMFEFYGSDSNEALEQMRAAASAILSGMDLLNDPELANRP